MKKAALGVALILLLGALGLQGGGKAEMRIVLATDLHYIAPAINDRSAYFTRIVEEGDGKCSLYAEEIAEAFVEEMLREKPQAVILSGDLTFNGAPASHRALAEKFARLKEAGIRVLALGGNHDLDNRNAAAFRADGFTRVTPTDTATFQEIWGPFGWEDAIARDASSLSYTSALADDLWVLMVDVNGFGGKGVLNANTLGWIRGQLDAARRCGAQVIGVSHQNLLCHNAMFANGFVMENARELDELYARYGVKLHLSGHMHLQHKKLSPGGTWEVVTSALCVSPIQYARITWDGKSFSYRTEKLDVSAWARARGLPDENLLDFPAYSEAFFRRSGTRAIVQALSGNPRAAEMLSYLEAANVALFSGRMDTFTPNGEMERLWGQVSPFAAAYLKTLIADAGLDSTALAIEVLDKES